MPDGDTAAVLVTWGRDLIPVPTGPSGLPRPQQVTPMSPSPRCQAARRVPDSLRGFTLLEVVVSATIAAGLLVAIGAAFHVGGAAWRRGLLPMERRLQAVAALERLSDDLRQAVRLGGVAEVFDGHRDAVGWVARGEGGALVRIRYRYDAEHHLLVRTADRFSEEGRRDDTTWRRAVPQLVDGAFTFPYRDEGGGAGGRIVWRDEWLWTDRIPAAIRVALTLNADVDREGVDDRVTVERIIVIPHGVIGDEPIEDRIEDSPRG